MPNWCNNSINLVGPRDKIRVIWEQARKKDEEGGGFLQALHPMPEDLKITAGYLGDTEEQKALEAKQAANLEKYGYKDWYDWCVNHWGTKWDVGLEGLEYEEDEDGNFDNGTGVPYARITGWFDSAWAPPISAMAFYGYRNEDVRITLDYHEPGMCFVGRYTVEEGLDDDECYDYNGTDSSTVRDTIGEELDDFWNISEQMAEWEEDSKDELEVWYEDGVEKRGLEPHRVGD